MKPHYSDHAPAAGGNGHGTRRRMWRKPSRRAVWIAVLVGAAALGAWIWYASHRPPEVGVQAVRAGPLVADWSAAGYVESRAADVSSPQVGRVAQVLVEEGDAVRAGQVLARIASAPEEAGARAQEQSAAAAAAQARASEAEIAAAAAAQPEKVAAARAQAAAARAELQDLERGPRPEEITQAEANTSNASAVYRRALLERNRQAHLLAEGAISHSALQDAQEALERAAANLKMSEAALALLNRGSRPEQIAAARARVQAADAGLEEAVAEAAHLRTLQQQAEAARAQQAAARSAAQQSQASLADRTITAPFTGVIGRRYVDSGALASPSQPLFRVVESGEPWVDAEVDEQDLGSVRQGQPVVVSASAYPGQEFPGSVAVIGAQAVPQTEVRTGARIVRVRISLDATPAERRRLLKPGMEVHVAGQTQVSPQAVLAPSDSILADSQGSFAWVLDRDILHRRRIRTGVSSGPATQVLSGLQPGEQVVVSGKEGLRDGERVKASEQPGDTQG